MAQSSFDPESTAHGELPPWEVAKVFAFNTVLRTMAEHMETPAAELIGMRADEFIAGQVLLKGGGHPSSRAVRKVIQRCSDMSWYPGKPTSARQGAGRKRVYSEFQRNEIARVAMDLKHDKLTRPTPRKVRARLPQLSRNPETGRPVGKDTIYQIFKTLCYDEKEDDPWQY
eukprot:2314632-Karenia_brevis.AAC.1